MDDEPLARLNLSSLLEDEPGFHIVGHCAGAEDAVRSIADLHPDLVFLDVEMPGGSGLDVLSCAAGRARPPAVVFVTAHDRFAARAYELEAVDYLLKPFRRERFQRVLARVRQHLGQDQVHTPSRIDDGAMAADRMMVKSAGRFVLVAFDELQYVRAAGNYVALHVVPEGGSGVAEVHEVRDAIGAIEARLPAGRFVRLHRSYIVSVAALVSLEPAGGGEFVARLRGGKELPVGASYLAGLRVVLERFGGWGEVK